MRDRDAGAARPFALSQSHRSILQGIESGQERLFYETEAVREQWTAQELQRYYDYDLFGRYAISCDKDALMKTVGRENSPPIPVGRNGGTGN